MSNRNSSLKISQLRWELESLDAALPRSGAGGGGLVRIANELVERLPALPPHRRQAVMALAGLALPSLAGAVKLIRRRSGKRAAPTVKPQQVTPSPGSTQTPAHQLTGITRNFLLGFILPLWLVAGLSDWLCHRRVRIERNAGSAESAMHLLMLGEAALPMLAGLFLEITSPVLLLMFGAVLAHGATALWDVSYAVKRRPVPPIEQHVHSYLEMVPVMAASFVAVLHWPEVRALFGFGRRAPDWSVRWKRSPLPVGMVAPLLAGTLALGLAPYIEEFLRTLRPRR